MKTYLWKSLVKGTRSEHDDFKWKTGKWYKTEESIILCKRGFHASDYIIDAMLYVPCSVIAKVEVRGNNIVQHDKQCWSEMRIVKQWKWKKEDSIGLAIYTASLVLDIFEKEYPQDSRPRNAIEMAKKYLKGQKIEREVVDEATREAYMTSYKTTGMARAAAEVAASASNTVYISMDTAAYAASAAASAAAGASSTVYAAMEPAVGAAIVAAYAARVAVVAAFSAERAAEAGVYTAVTVDTVITKSQVRDKTQKWILRRLNKRNGG